MNRAMMEYKGYLGRVEFDDEASVFHGEVVNTRDVITFQGDSVGGLKRAFHASVNDYLEFCAERGEEPDKPFSGQFVTRISPELHRRAHLAAILSGQSLNAWITEQLQSAVSRIGGDEADRLNRSRKQTRKQRPRRRSEAKSQPPKAAKAPLRK